MIIFDRFSLSFYRPDKIDLEKIYQRDNKQNLQQAFDLAESEFNITKLLDPEDVDVISPDEKSLITYISSLYNAIPHVQPHPSQIQREKVSSFVRFYDFTSP